MATVTKVTINADVAIVVMSQAAPTPWIRTPKLDTKLAVQNARKMRLRNGVKIPGTATRAVVVRSIFALTALRDAVIGLSPPG